MQQHNINNTQRIITGMELNQSFPINSITVHGDSSHNFSTLLSSCSCFSYALNANELQCTKEGAYIPFSLSRSTTIKSTINSYLTTLNLLNAFLSTKDVSLKAQGPFYIQVFFFNMTSLNSGATTSKAFQNLYRRCPAVFSTRCAGSLGE